MIGTSLEAESGSSCCRFLSLAVPVEYDVLSSFWTVRQCTQYLFRVLLFDDLLSFGPFTAYLDALSLPSSIAWPPGLLRPQVLACSPTRLLLPAPRYVELHEPSRRLGGLALSFGAQQRYWRGMSNIAGRLVDCGTRGVTTTITILSYSARHRRLSLLTSSASITHPLMF